MLPNYSYIKLELTFLVLITRFSVIDKEPYSLKQLQQLKFIKLLKENKGKIPNRTFNEV